MNTAPDSVPLFDRLPERLMLDGFRCWIKGYATGDHRHWEEAWRLYVASLGPHHARPLVDRLAWFVRTVSKWSVCPVACFPGGCRHICRHECFALAMVAAGQHRDFQCLATAMHYLLEPEGHKEAMSPACAFGEAMAESGLTLTRFPTSIVEEIAGRPLHRRLH